MKTNTGSENPMRTRTTKSTNSTTYMTTVSVGTGAPWNDHKISKYAPVLLQRPNGRLYAMLPSRREVDDVARRVRRDHPTASVGFGRTTKALLILFESAARRISSVACENRGIAGDGE